MLNDPGGGNGNPLQYSCQEDSMDRGAWLAKVHGVTKSQTQLRTCVRAHTRTYTQNEMLKKVKYHIISLICRI